jgi:hypothetical protein
MSEIDRIDPRKDRASRDAWANLHYNSEEYYQRRKDSIPVMTEFFQKYPTLEEYKAREKIGFLGEDEIFNLSDETMSVIDNHRYSDTIERLDYAIKHVADYDAGIRIRFTLDGVEKFSPDGTVLSTYRKGDKDK